MADMDRLRQMPAELFGDEGKAHPGQPRARAVSP